MVAISWSSLLPLLVISSLVIYDDWVCTPSCKILPGTAPAEYGSDSDDLKVMMVANLLLLGSDSGFVNHYFRDYYMAKFFRKSYYSVNPDMLLVLGDVSAKGSELSRSKWLPVLRQFHQILGPFLDLPFHVTLGDRDVGECSGLDAKSVNRIAANFPVLDSAGCGAFEISNISFVSLNGVALLCGNNKLRFSVEKAVERESARVEDRRATEGINDSSKFSKTYNGFTWRENAMSSGSGPVLLLHFPLHRTVNNKCSPHISNTQENRGFFSEPAPYDLLQTVPPNGTEYIFQALKPRIVFSAHTHEFCDHTHSDGTREVTVSAMTWNARDDPGFVVATFHANRREVSVSYCSLARESYLLITYTSVMVLLVSIMLVTNASQLRCLRQ